MPARVTFDANRISIACRKFWPFLIFGGIWLVLWSLGGVIAFSEMIRHKSGPPGGVLAAAIVAWALADLCVAIFWLWFAFGREVITISEGKLVVRNEILGHGRNKTFPLPHVTKLRASGLFGSLYTWSGMFKIYGLSEGVIAFECDGRTHRFGKLLDENEAQEIVRELRNRIG
jgi:hypothetical protein